MRRQLGFTQFATLGCALATSWLQWLTRALGASGKLWPCAQDLFRRMFRQLCREAGLGHLGLTPASGRTGGATHHYVMGVEIARLKFMGRWASIDSLAHYIQEALSTACTYSLSPGSREILERLATAHESIRPP